MICFYHKSDLDGQCSGAIVKQANPTCKMIGVDYRDTDPIALTKITPGEVVFVVDFCFPKEEMTRLKSITTDLTVWIDHHKSSMDIMPDDYPGHREIGRAACVLTWEYIYHSPVPTAVNLIGRYDVWAHDEQVLDFQYGMRAVKYTQPDSGIWKVLFTDDSGGITGAIENNGRVIRTYEEKQNHIKAAGMAFEAEFHGYRAICINAPYSNSKIFDSVYNPKKHDLMIVFGVRPDEVKYSLYSDNPEIDVAQIAEQYGGGGHQGAAGFYTNRLLF